MPEFGDIRVVDGNTCGHHPTFYRQAWCVEKWVERAGWVSIGYPSTEQLEKLGESVAEALSRPTHTRV